MALGYLSVFLLAAVGVLCAVGVFHPLYRDTIGERVGMSMVSIWCLQRVVDKLQFPFTEPVHLMLHTGLFIFAVGMASAKYKARHRIRGVLEADARVKAARRSTKAAR